MRDAPVGVGIIGTGFGASVVAPAFSGSVQASVNGICGGNADRARAAASTLGVGFVTDQISELCGREDIDLVFVAAPPHVHRRAVLSALNGGKHVVCEKPFGTGPIEAQEMLDHATRLGRLHFLDFEFRTYPARREVSRILERGDLGQLEHVIITAMVTGTRFPILRRPGWWQQRELGGGWLGAMGSHYVDALRNWFGEIKSVAATLETRRVLPSATLNEALVLSDDGFTALFMTEAGIPCLVRSASTVGVEVGPRIEIYGSEGTVILERDRLLSFIDQSGKVTGHDYGEDSHPHPSRGPLGAWAAEIVEAVIADRQTEPSFLDGLRCQEVLAAVYRSHDNGGVVTAVERSVETAPEGA